MVAASGASAQPVGTGLSVLPVNVVLPAGQLAAVLTLTNEGDRETTFQIRPFGWSQPGGADDLAPTDELAASPPIATIAPGASQVVRLVLRQPARGQEATYRILLDQLPQAPRPGEVGFVLRLSIPVFASSGGGAQARLHWTVEEDQDGAFLVAVNDGGRHERVSDITLVSSLGPLEVEGNVSPYVLAGATRRWRILKPNFVLNAGDSLRLTARADSGSIDEPVPVLHARP